MVNLRLTEDDLAGERQVIAELRRSIWDNKPDVRLTEKMVAALYRAHPYGQPAVGIAKYFDLLSLEDVQHFHKVHYAPNNAVLVVSGDVTPDDVQRLAGITYGQIASSRGAGRRGTVKVPSQISARRVSLVAAHPESADFRRIYAFPTWGAAAPGEVEALQVLTQILAGGAASRLYLKLVNVDKVAATVHGVFESNAVEAGELILIVQPSGSDIAAVETGIDHVLDDIRRHGIQRDELAHAKKFLVGNFIFNSNDQVNLALRYGWAAVLGRTIKDVDEWPQAISAVSAAEVNRVAEKYLVASRSVTGWLAQRGRKHGRAIAALSERRVP